MKNLRTSPVSLGASLRRVKLKTQIIAIVTALIRLYQKLFSPDHGAASLFSRYGRCRFFPSCSAYAADALRQYGLLSGGMASMRRIVRCHPWSRGGYDPIC